MILGTSDDLKPKSYLPLVFSDASGVAYVILVTFDYLQHKAT